MSLISNKELGGYFELELASGIDYHKDALCLNSARNCLKYILKTRQPLKVYIPAYCCDSLIEPLESENIQYILYHVDENYELIDFPKLKEGEKLLYINYFALKSAYINVLHEYYGKHLIIDNTQAFFEMPINNIDTFYSPRKFFGVPDGGYLYTDACLTEPLGQSLSSKKFGQLLGRYEWLASDFYTAFQVSESSLVNQPIQSMSKLTLGILKSLRYDIISLKRQRNFWALHTMLKDSNLFDFNDRSDFVPMVYPYKTKDAKLRSKLIEGKCYVAKYWSDAEARVNAQEKSLIEDILYLPIDQRVEMADIFRIVGLIHDA